MSHEFKVGDQVEWNSEAGRVRGTIKKKFTSETEFKGYLRHASKDEPQYLIKSNKTEHLAMHKGSALKKLPTSAKTPRGCQQVDRPAQRPLKKLPTSAKTPRPKKRPAK